MKSFIAFLIAVLLYQSVIVKVDARAIIHARMRHKLRSPQRLQASRPVGTIARLCIEPPVLASTDGHVIDPNPPSELVSELVMKRVEGDLGGYRAILSAQTVLSQQDAFHLYKDSLLAPAPAFKAEILSICRPILLSPKLAEFLLFNQRYLQEVFDDFSAEKGRLSGLLMERSLMSGADETSFLTLTRVCDVNAPLSNGFPAIYHAIYDTNLPEYFLEILLNHPDLDISVEAQSGEVPALWSNRPLLIHAWIYNTHAFNVLSERFQYSVLQIFSSIYQVIYALST